MALETFANFSRSELVAHMGPSDLTFSVSSLDAPFFPTANFYAVIDIKNAANSEIVYVTSRVNNVFYINSILDRAQFHSGNGGIPTEHYEGATVVHGLLASDAQNFVAHIAATTNIHGVSGALAADNAVVHLAQTETISGAKTFTAPLVATNTTRITGLVTNIVAKSSAYTLTSTDNVILADASVSAFTLTLPVAPAGTIYRIKKMDSNNDVTIVTTSGNIDGTNSVLLRVQYDSIDIVSSGSNYVVL